METIKIKVKDVAEPDQIASGMAGTGQKNISWSVITRGLVAVDIGDLDIISCTNFRWIRRLQRQIARLKERKKARTAKHPVIRRGGVAVRSPQNVEDSTGDLIFTLAERQDRIQKYLQKKIERLDRRITALEERGRS
jgi:NADH:ubiquinone oxidoreductase subunit D